MRANRYIGIFILLATVCCCHAQYSHWHRKTDEKKIQLEPRVQIASKMDSCCISEDGRYVLTWGGSHGECRVSLWETSSGKIIRTPDVLCKSASFSEFEPYIIYVHNDSLPYGVAEIWDMRSGEKVGYTSKFNNKVFAPYYAKIDKDQGVCNIYSANTQERVSALVSSTIGFNGDIVLSPDRKYLLFTGENAFVWDIENACIHAEIPLLDYLLRQEPPIRPEDRRRYMGWKMWVSGGFLDNDRIWLGAYDGYLTYWTKEGLFIDRKPLHHALGFDAYQDEKTKNWYIGLSNGLQVGEQLVKVPKGYYSILYDVLDVPMENRVYACGDGGLFYLDKSDPTQLVKIPDFKYGMFCMALSPDGKHMLIGSESGGAYVYTVGQKNSPYMQHTTKYGRIRACAFIDNETFVVGSLSSKGTLEFFRIGQRYPFKVVEAHPGGVRAIAVDNERKLLYSAAKNMEFKVWNLDSKELVSTVTPLKDYDYIIRTPDGYLKTSPNAARQVMFGKGMQLYGFEQFEWKYNRPDIVASRMGASPEYVRQLYAAYRKRLRRIGIREEQLSASTETPSVLLHNTSMHMVTTARQTIDMEAQTPSGTIQAINVWLNGTPIHDAVKPVEEGCKKIQQTMSLELVPGENHIEVSCLSSEGVESLRESRSVFYSAPEETTTRWVVAIGVGRYENAAYNLTYPAKDAKDIASLLSTAPSKHSKTQVLVLTDEQVTPAILPRIRQWLAQAQRRDEAVIYYAGHGVLDKDAEYYLSSYAMDFAHPSTQGIRYEDMDDILAHIRPLKKMLIIDACHAGEVDKEDLAVTTAAIVKGKVRFRGNALSLSESMRQAKETSLLMSSTFADIRRGSGATTLVSASGMEVAMESDDWHNGLFTYAIRQALSGANADSDQDGEVSSNELIRYVTKQVEQLSGGTQNPVLRNINYTNNMVFVPSK